MQGLLGARPWGSHGEPALGSSGTRRSSRGLLRGEAGQGQAAVSAGANATRSCASGTPAAPAGVAGGGFPGEPIRCHGGEGVPGEGTATAPAPAAPGRSRTAPSASPNFPFLASNSLLAAAPSLCSAQLARARPHHSPSHLLCALPSPVGTSSLPCRSSSGPLC